jgi:predicted ATPase
LTTSREPLRAEGERSYRLPPMENAPANSRFTAEAAQDFSAVRLFVERATASQSEFVLKDQDVPMLTEICRRLDGIPLAIELAAAQVAALGIRGLSERLSSRFSLLLRGRRTALPRHQTLLATLDWSYDLLPDNERTVLRRVAIFSGAFTTDAVSAVAENHVTLLDAVGCVASLISKSLIVAEVSDVAGYLRLHDTTRTYALNKLAQSGEYEQVARRHAEFFCAFVKRSEAEWDIRPIADWRGVYRRQIDNLRTAMDWAASPTGDSSIALALTVASVPLWVEFSLIAECRRRVEQALERLGSGSSQGTRHEMQLYAALGLSLMFTTGAAPETCTALTKALAIAESINDRDYQLRLLWGLWADRLNNRDFVATLARAKQFRELATTDAGPADVAIGDRLIGFSLHFLGDQSGAREHTERMLKNHVPVAQGSHVVRFQFDQPTVARVGLARILWLQGFPEQGLRMAKDAIDHAVSLGHVLSLCNALIQAGCPLSLLAGDLAAASRYLAALRLHTEGHGLDVWRTCGNCFEGQLRILSGELNDGPRLLAMAIEELSTAGYVQYQSVFLATLADGAARAGRVAEGMAAINRAVALSAAAEEGWCMAELLRGKGELLLLEALPNAATAAEEHFLKAMDLARQQGALSWELRAATSLVRLRRDQGDVGAAGHLLSSVYQRFTEGFETADLRAAKVFLDAMA